MTTTSDEIETEIRGRLDAGSIIVDSLEVKSYPEETTFIVHVPASMVAAAVDIAGELDEWINARGFRGFVVVRRSSDKEVPTSTLTSGVADGRATSLVQLINARSRVSEAQPSLAYVHDSAANMSAIASPRHHLVFGRRGAGKSALLVESKRQAELSGDITAWVNLQTLRHEEPQRVFLYVVDEMLNSVAKALSTSKSISNSAVALSELTDEVARALASDKTSMPAAHRLIPRVQKVLKRSLDLAGCSLYVFVDDFYFLPLSGQPTVLDMLHGCVRDCDAWLKVASIRHLTRWFETSPPLGLQTGQDADILDLDVTLQDPAKAKRFLEDVLANYADRSGVRRLTSIFGAKALDRLVLASGSVPRDYLVLSAAAIRKAQGRSGSRLVGVQDVNQAAGDAAQAKIQELEDDLAGNHGSAARTLSALQILRTFCLEETACTYLRIDFADKEGQPQSYNVLTGLLDVRLLHLLDASVSDAHTAGARSECYMLDLSQFSGSRLKQGIRVLDIVNGELTSRTTRVGASSVRVGTTARQLLTIFRGAPLLELSRLSHLV